MNRKCLLTLALLGLALLFTTPATAQGTAGSFFAATGEISVPNQTDSVAFDVDTEGLTLGDDGELDVTFVMSAEPGSSLDPGLIQVAVAGGNGSVGGGAQKPDTAGSTASLSLTELQLGSYTVSLQGEHGTLGAYRLDAFLTGDANGDLMVDADDVSLINDLSGSKLGDSDYSALADTDRNGVINGGDRQRAIANLGSAAVPEDPINPLDVFLPVDALQLVGLSETGFNSRLGPLQFSLTGAEFEQELAEVTLAINGSAIPENLITVEANLITVAINLAEGRNDISLKTYDTVGRPLYLEKTIWAGTASLQVELVNPDGSPFLQPATVTATLSDDQLVNASVTTATGSAVFTDLPNRTILLQAQGSGNEVGTAGVLGAEGSATIVMLGFNEPSDIDNNDFSQGLAGWDVGSAPVAIVSHVEDIPGFPIAPLGFDDPRQKSQASLVDDDLQLGTSGEGEQSVSRTFTSDEGVTGVRVRYRFITSEVPGGYFGSEFNDYFRVSLRSQMGGGFESENNSMNGLGLAAFDFGSGSTDWREVILPLDREGDTVQVDIAVANVADGLFDSQVVVDFVEELRDVVMPALAWNNTQGGLDLTYSVESEPLEDVNIEVFWANGTAASNAIGAAVFTETVAAGTAPGMYGPVRIDGATLDGDPNGTTHLIAVSSPTEVGSVADVSIAYGPNADQGAVSAGMVDAVKDALRAAGQSNATITSTARTPADQARAMFQNLVNPARTIAQNIQVQLGIYAAPGDAVINEFANQVAGLPRGQVIAMAGAIQGAMVTEINAQGPSNVSRHCADPTMVSVVDVSAAPFNNQNAPLFEASAAASVDRLIDERNTNNCFHLELGVGP